MLDELYQIKNPIVCLGGSYQHPKNGFPRLEWVLVARLDATNEEGQPVEVYETRAPTAFFKVVALPTKNKTGYTIATGSSRGELAGQIAKDIADGMLGLK
jgi:hypothetical protein